MSNLLAYKTAYLSRKTQLVIFDDSGYLLNSCETLYNINQHREECLYDIFPLIGNLKSRLVNLTIKDYEISIPRIEFAFPEDERIYDFIFLRIKDGDQEPLLWIMHDHTEHYKYLINIQQERNEAIVKNEYLSIENKLLELDKEIQILKNSEKDKQFYNQRFSNQFLVPFQKINKKLQLLENKMSFSSLQIKLKKLQSEMENLSESINLSLIGNSKNASVLSGLDLKKNALSSIFWSTIKLVESQQKSDLKFSLQFEVDDEAPKEIYSDSKKIIQVIYNLLLELMKNFEKGIFKIHVAFENEINGKTNMLVNFFLLKTEEFEKYKAQFVNELEEIKSGNKFNESLAVIEKLIQQLGGNIIFKNEEAKENEILQICFPVEVL